MIKSWCMPDAGAYFISPANGASSGVWFVFLFEFSMDGAPPEILLFSIVESQTDGVSSDILRVLFF
jgi:hypothetical protein